MNRINAIKPPLDNMMNNKYIYTVLSIFLAMYAALIAPQLKNNFTLLFKRDLFKILILFVIGYFSTKNYSVALLMAIVFFILQQTFTTTKFRNKIQDVILGKDVIKKENFNQGDRRRYKNIPEEIGSIKQRFDGNSEILDEAGLINYDDEGNKYIVNHYMLNASEHEHEHENDHVNDHENDDFRYTHYQKPFYGEYGRKPFDSEELHIHD